MKNKILNIENEISKIHKIEISSEFCSLNLKDFKKENKGILEKYSWTLNNYYRNFFIENILIEKENKKTKFIYINFTNEEKKPIRTVKNTRLARIIQRSSTPKNTKFTKSEIIFYFSHFTIKILYDIKTSSSTLILQYKI